MTEQQSVINQVAVVADAVVNNKCTAESGSIGDCQFVVKTSSRRRRRLRLWLWPEAVWLGLWPEAVWLGLRQRIRGLEQAVAVIELKILARKSEIAGSIPYEQRRHADPVTVPDHISEVDTARATQRRNRCPQPRCCIARIVTDCIRHVITRASRPPRPTPVAVSPDPQQTLHRKVSIHLIVCNQRGQQCYTRRDQNHYRNRDARRGP